MRSQSKSRLWAICYTLLLCAFTLYVLLDAFVIKRTYALVEPLFSAVPTGDVVAADDIPAAPEVSDVPTSGDAGTPVLTDTAYADEHIQIALTTYRELDSNVHVADVLLTDVSGLKTAFAENAYGRNITAPTSAIAAEHDAILAVNGDYYGAQRSGYVIRNGVLYREIMAGAQREDLCVWPDGSFTIVQEGNVSASDLLESGALHVFSFGPALIQTGEVAVNPEQEVGKAMANNPRTAIAMIAPLHYLFVVADGRTEESAGLSLYEMAVFLKGLGAQVAYNLDGGGSSTLVFDGRVINYPTTNGKSYAERAVSDIVYIH